MFRRLPFVSLLILDGLCAVYRIGRLAARRSIRAWATDNPTVSVWIDIYAKHLLLSRPGYQDHALSLKQYALHLNRYDPPPQLKAPQPITQSTVQRKSHEGLKEIQKLIFETFINENKIREFYRIDVRDEIVFISLYTNEAKHPQAAAGLELILGSFKYKGTK